MCAESLELGRIDPLGEGPQIVPGSEPTLVITVEARLARRSTTLALLVPWVDDRARRGGLRQPRRGRRPHRRPAARQPPCAPGCARSTSTCAPRSATTHLALEDVLALRPGDVVRLDAMAGDDTAVYADGVPVHRARAGRSGSRRAIQILGPYGEETR